MPRALPAFAAAALLTAGCGYVGGPLTPLANVPSRVIDLAAVQRDSRIIVQFTVPRLTTEGVQSKTSGRNKRALTKGLRRRESGLEIGPDAEGVRPDLF